MMELVPAKGNFLGCRPICLCIQKPNSKWCLFPQTFYASLLHGVCLKYRQDGWYPKTLYKKTVQANVDDDILNKQCFSRAHTVERRE